MVSKNLTIEEQMEIVKRIKKKYAHFLEIDLKNNILNEYKNNFIATEGIESIKIFEMDNVPADPNFTIAIPTYNRCDTLKKAIDSAILQNIDECYEIIIVENVDNFEIQTQAQKMLESQYKGRLTYYKNKGNIGMIENWNRCLTLAKGKWVCLLHSDDTIMSNYLYEIKRIVSNPKYSDTILIGCYDSQFPVGGVYRRIVKYLQRNNNLDDLYYDCPTKNLGSATAILHNRIRSIQIGGYNPNEYPSSDYFFHYRAFKKEGGVLFYRKSLKTTRIHSGQDGKQWETLLAFCLLHIIFVLNANTPSFCAKKFAFEEIQYTQENFLANHPVFIDFTEELLTHFNIKKASKFMLKINRLVHFILLIFKRFLKLDR